MTTTVVILGLGIAAVGYAGRAILRVAPKAAENLQTKLNSLPKTPTFSSSIFTDTRYYKGGFETKMSRREAALILGISPNASKAKIKEVHKRIMILNHPDKGGSPYIAAKINEAKDLLDKEALKAR